MKTNTAELVKRNDKKLARPLNVLIPLIRKDVEDAERAATEAAVPYQIAAGGKLIEAKSQVKHGKWVNWVKSNIGIGMSAAQEWMRMADSKTRDRVVFVSSHDFRVKTNRRYAETHKERFKVPPAWQPEVKDMLKDARAHFAKADVQERDGEKEVKEEKKLAIRLIDIGYKILSVELHPDKGGSQGVMQRLNAVRENLKGCVNEW